MGRTVALLVTMGLEDHASQGIICLPVDHRLGLRRTMSPTLAHENSSIETILKGDLGVTVIHALSALSV